ncbi:hypothetical protein ACIQ8D_06570 [Streptomyces sp. NPDC096094]|uniref:hypothetical protein n=1 Tax=Streptomyces sp. NPDC096094 TaxID=3366073 RepID=UPI0038253784
MRAPEHVRPVAGVPHYVVPTERLPPPSAVREALRPRRPSGSFRMTAGSDAPSAFLMGAGDFSERAVQGLSPDPDGPARPVGPSAAEEVGPARRAAAARAVLSGRTSPPHALVAVTRG